MADMTKATNELLRKARIERGFETAAEAARYFGWVESTYTSHENGVRPITRQAARRYAAAFGVDPSALIGFSPGDVISPSVKVKGEAALGTWRDSRVDKNWGIRI